MFEKIKELKRVQIGDIRPRDDNWQLHPEHQRGALLEVFRRIGFIHPVLVREIEDAEHRYELLDGHLRRETAAEIGDDVMAVVLQDVSDEDADRILATVNSISKQAQTDKGKFKELVAKLKGAFDESADLKHIIALETTGSKSVKTAMEKIKDKAKKLPVPEGMDLRAHEHYDYILVLSQSLTDWQNILERFGLMDATTGKSNQKHALGQGRAVWAGKLLQYLESRASVDLKEARERIAALEMELSNLRGAVESKTRSRKSQSKPSS